MLNARTIKKWLLDNVPSADATAIIRQHMVAVRYLPTHYVCTLPLFHSCITDLLLYTMLLVWLQLCNCSASSAIPKAVAFGISADNVFGFWDWVGGRFSVCSAVGVLPLSLQYGFPIVEQFLSGAHDMDTVRSCISFNQYIHLLNNTVSFETFYLFSQHFFEAPLRGNLPVLLGLIGIWNSSFLGYNSRAILPCSNSNYIYIFCITWSILYNCLVDWMVQMLRRWFDSQPISSRWIWRAMARESPWTALRCLLNVG